MFEISHGNAPGHLQGSRSRRPGNPLNLSADISSSATLVPLPQDAAMDESPLPPPAGSNVGIWKKLCTGASIIDITTERESPKSDFNRPLFMKGINFSANIAQWNTTVLPYIRQLTFRIASTVDVYWFDAMIRSRALPGLMNNVTKLDLTGFHWFSGISPNRSVNPYLASASQLSSLREVSFTLHAASITTSLWSERQAIELEITDPVRSQARRVLTLRTVLVKYGLDAFFNCTKLEHIGLMYINSDIVTANIQFKDPEKLIEAIEKWLASGFKKRQQQVLVTSSQAT